MQRYSFYCSLDGGGPAEPEPDEQGDWVRYVDSMEALVQRADSPDIVVTKNDAGQIVAVTQQDSDGRILSVILESAIPQDAQPESVSAADELAQLEPLIARSRALYEEWAIAVERLRVQS